MPAANVPAIVLIYDIRGFTAASKRLKTADLGAFATGAHRAILDLFAAHPPTFVKNLGDGHLLLWETGERPDPALLDAIVEGAGRARAAFAAFVKGHGAAGETLPSHVGLGVAFGEVSRSDDYYGVALNRAARLQNLARPEGMALDRTVFEEVSQRDQAFKTDFKRARVRLKGLGSTVVWVNRPFSWRRLAGSLAPVGAAVLLLLGYAGLADADLAVPAGNSIRRFLDAHGLSLLRRPRSEGEVRVAAQTLRRDLAEVILRARAKEGWVPDNLTEAGRARALSKDVDVWGSSQALCAVMKAPEVSLADAQSLLAGMRHAAGRLVTAGGVVYGWPAHAGEPYTEAEPALWAVAALATALGRPGVIPKDQRATVLAWLSDAQAAADLHRPTREGVAWDGGWNMFPNQVELERRAPYTTALALLCLLETRAADLPWRGSVEVRDALLRATAGRLQREFGTYAGITGWRRMPDAADPVSVGLSLQIHSELLRAEALAGIEVPAGIEAALLRQLSALSAETPYDAGENDVTFVNHKGEEVKRSESINFLVDPWAIEACVRWLERAAKKGADPADVTAVRRTLGRLVVDQRAKYTEAVSGWTFVASETLYALSSIPPP